MTYDTIEEIKLLLNDYNVEWDYMDDLIDELCEVDWKVIMKRLDSQ